MSKNILEISYTSRIILYSLLKVVAALESKIALHALGTWSVVDFWICSTFKGSKNFLVYFFVWKETLNEETIACAKSDSAVYYLRQQHKFGIGYAAKRRQMSPQFSTNWFVRLAF